MQALSLKMSWRLIAPSLPINRHQERKQNERVVRVCEENKREEL